MEPHTETKLVVVTRKTRLEELVARHNTISQAKFYIEHLGADFMDYVHEHEVYHSAIHEARTVLERLGRVQLVERSFLPNFIFGAKDVVIAIGQDGLVVNTMKYLEGQPLLGVNPEPARWDGVLLPWRVGDLARRLPSLLTGRFKTQEVTMAKASLSGGQVLYGVNDIFIGPKSHTSARYTIRVGAQQEQQSSSGIIVSTGLGSTGWLRSVRAGALAIADEDAQGGDRHAPMPWDARYLHFAVREPFASKTSSASLVCGTIDEQHHLTLESAMPENGVIFSDGIESDYLEFNAGMTVSLSIAEKSGYLVI
jgi:NAD kinase